MRTHEARTIAHFRNFIFGVEDSLVSTVGLLSGIALAGVPVETILLTGTVLIFVEAFSMAAGTYLSESSAAELAGNVREKFSALVSSVTMFVSYFCAGFIPLSPYVLLEASHALPVSIVASVATLFLLGYISGIITRTSRVRSALRMALIGGAAIGIGFFAASLLS
ncbi:MAG: VIT1/CCC1 transporter family protein [Candidatus Pacebacteria bacterium]|nr:VIT1/CCC1 transporter family protein [Candidatus Paceibacterota bacterium]MBP9840244.1 VIT1/CCC1 transporter family protein [Candidatus Paceibacterota bacterium]